MFSFFLAGYDIQVEVEDHLVVVVEGLTLTVAPQGQSLAVVEVEEAHLWAEMHLQGRLQGWMHLKVIGVEIDVEALGRRKEKLVPTEFR